MVSSSNANLTGFPSRVLKKSLSLA
ncbi:MAG: hypothetical protein QOH35_4250, partial [Acidobacteriaceae bacterium]|nr:hypothetical protein [Acidobacteriaceae bacterium]